MGYEELAIGIMQQAAEDYRVAKWQYENGKYLERMRAAVVLDELERFFNSNQADIYSFGKAGYLLEQLKNEETPEKLKRKAKRDII